MRLKDKVALVTGAASGIGRAAAALFGQEGAKVMCADVDGEGAERMARQIADSGGEAASTRADVSVAAGGGRVGGGAGGGGGGGGTWRGWWGRRWSAGGGSISCSTTRGSSSGCR